MLRRTFAFLQAARVLSTSATQGGASFLDAAGAGLLTAGERLQRAADGLPFRWDSGFVGGSACIPVFGPPPLAAAAGH